MILSMCSVKLVELGEKNTLMKKRHSVHGMTVPNQIPTQFRLGVLMGTRFVASNVQTLHVTVMFCIVLFGG